MQRIEIIIAGFDSVDVDGIEYMWHLTDADDDG